MLEIIGHNLRIGLLSSTDDDLYNKIRSLVLSYSMAYILSK